LGYY